MHASTAEGWRVIEAGIVLVGPGNQMTRRGALRFAVLPRENDQIVVGHKDGLETLRVLFVAHFPIEPPFYDMDTREPIVEVHVVHERIDYGTSCID